MAQHCIHPIPWAKRDQDKCYDVKPEAGSTQIDDVGRDGTMRHGEEYPSKKDFFWTHFRYKDEDGCKDPKDSDRIYLVS